MNENPYEPPETDPPPENADSAVPNSPEEQHELAGETLIYANVAILIFLVFVIYMSR